LLNIFHRAFADPGSTPGISTPSPYTVWYRATVGAQHYNVILPSWVIKKGCAQRSATLLCYVWHEVVQLHQCIMYTFSNV